MESIIREYVAGLANMDIPKCLKLFSSNGMVHSPFYGDLPVEQFLTELFSDTDSEDIQIVHVMFSNGADRVASVLLDYSWVLKDKTQVSFQMVIIFEFEVEAPLINNITLFYDTSKISTQL